MLSEGRKTAVETSHLFVEQVKNDKFMAFLLGLWDPSTSATPTLRMTNIRRASIKKSIL